MPRRARPYNLCWSAQRDTGESTTTDVAAAEATEPFREGLRGRTRELRSEKAPANLPLPADDGHAKTWGSRPNRPQWWASGPRRK